MPKFGDLSTRNLSECDPRLQKIFNEVIKHIDCSIICGHRNESVQNYLFTLGRTKLKWPLGKHNLKPSQAVDAVPFPIIWPDKNRQPKTYEKDLARLYFFVGYVKSMADQMGIEIISGADWDDDNDFTDNGFNDLPTVELVN